MNKQQKTMRRVVEYSACPECSCWSLGVQGNGRIVRHSEGFGSVEKVGPGTRHSLLRTTICRGSGAFVGLTDSGKKRLKKLLAKGKLTCNHDSKKDI